MADARRERFEALFAEHFDAVLRFAAARAEQETAKDVTAETFMAAWRGLDAVPASPRAWLLSVARNKIADAYRATGRRDALAAALEFQVAQVPDPAEDVAANSGVRAAFARLSAGDQELLRLLAWDGLSRADAAQVLGLSPAVFAVRLHRARRRLRESLAQRKPSEDPIDHYVQETRS